MESKDKNIELIERYLDGQLSEKELKAFEKRRSEDPEFQSSVEEMEALVAGVKESARNSLLDDLKNLEASLPEITEEDFTDEESSEISSAKPSKGKGRKVFLRTLQAITAAACLTGLYFGFGERYYQFFQNPEQYRKEAVPLVAMNITPTRGETGQSANLKNLVDNYERNKFGAIISDLKNIDNKTDVEWMLLGNSYFRKKKFKRASECYLPENFSQDSELMDDAKFSLAMCYNSLGQIEDAKIILINLSDHPGDFTKAAEDLLTEKRFRNK